MTYKAVAKLVGKPRAWRAVGNILAKNKNPFNCKTITRRSGATSGSQIPCHRVVRSDGKIGGFKKGATRKIKILKKEGIKIRRRKLVK